MNISSYHIQNVIRAYGQRVGRRGALTKLLPENKPRTPDVITISPEAKQRQVMERVASEIVARVQGRVENPALGSKLVERLSQELGGTLDVTPDLEKGSGFKFRVIDPKKGEVLKELSVKDTEDMIVSIYQRLSSQLEID